MKHLKPSKKPNPGARGKMIPVRADAADAAIIEQNARRYTEGNVSEWMRIAGVRFRPKKEDFEK